MGKIYSTKNDSNIYKKARQATGLTQLEVSKRLNINRSSISKWESGSSIPDPALLPKIAKLYNVTTDYLLGLDNFDTNITTSNTIPRIKELRGAHTQDYIAKQLGLNRQTYRNYENGDRQADYATLMHIADYFNVSIDYLLGRSESSAVFVRDTQLNNHTKNELSDKFLEDYSQLLKDSSFIETTKLYNAISTEYRALCLGVLLGVLQHRGVDTSKILGY